MVCLCNLVVLPPSDRCLPRDPVTHVVLLDLVEASVDEFVKLDDVVIPLQVIDHNHLLRDDALLLWRGQLHAEVSVDEGKKDALLADLVVPRLLEEGGWRWFGRVLFHAFVLWLARDYFVARKEIFGADDALTCCL